MVDLPKYFLEDFSFYRQAFDRALAGEGAYAMLEIGRGFFYPPPALLVVGLFASIDPPDIGNAFYLIANLICLAMIVWLIGRRYSYSVQQIWWWFPLVLFFAPTLEALRVGQINIITEFGIALLYVFSTSAPWLGGIGIALAVGTKAVPLVFFAYWIVNRNWRAFFCGIVSIVISLMLVGVLFGWQTLLNYPLAFQWIGNWFSSGPDANVQALVTMAQGFGWIRAAQWVTFQQSLEIYLALIFAVSGVLAFSSRMREPFFIVLCLGSMVAPNVLWYHHYVFFLVPFLVWMAWSRLNPWVVVWCSLGLTIVQIDRNFRTYGFLIHLVAHTSMLMLVAWQMRMWFVARGSRMLTR